MPVIKTKVLICRKSKVCFVVKTKTIVNHQNTRHEYFKNLICKLFLVLAKNCTWKFLKHMHKMLEHVVEKTTLACESNIRLGGH